MILPPQNHLVFSGFGYSVSPGTRDNKTIKALTLMDVPTGLQMSFLFSEEEWEQFVQKIGERLIIPATQVPK